MGLLRVNIDLPAFFLKMDYRDLRGILHEDLTPTQYYALKLSDDYSLGKKSLESRAFRASNGLSCPFCGATDYLEPSGKTKHAIELDSRLIRQWDGHASPEQIEVVASCKDCGCSYKAVKTVSELRENTSNSLRVWDSLECDFVIRHPENIPNPIELSIRYGLKRHDQRSAFIRMVSIKTLKSMGFDRAFIKANKKEPNKPFRRLSRRQRKALLKAKRAKRLGFDAPNY